MTSPPIVQTKLGLLRGRNNGRAEEFVGVRYAQQPNRFSRSVPDTQTWEGIRDALSTAPKCWSPSGFPCIAEGGESPAVACKSASSDSMSEDCLFLDIYRPIDGSADVRTKRPVMVWIHGGGMITGDSGSWSSLDIGNGTVLASQQGVVVVSINYRLGPLGFLPLWGFGGSGSGGMNGLNDQIVALRWLQANVEAFGGDPERVTLFGCSAGSLSICTLSASPVAAGLFNRVILESGPCLGPWGPGTFAEGQAVAARAMASMNASSLADLLALPPWAVLWGQGQDQYDIEFPGYWIDGWVAPEHPALRLRKGSWNPEGVLLGGNSRDGVVGTEYVAAADLPTSVSAYSLAMRKHWRPRNVTGGVFGANRLLAKSVGNEVAAAYSLGKFENGGGAAGAFKAADGDYNVVCPMREIARAVATLDRAVYLYYFTHGPLIQSGCGGRPDVGTSPPVNDGWANHGFEQNFVFGVSVTSDTCRFQPSEIILSEAIQSFWASFAAGGKPVAISSINVTLWNDFGETGEALRLALGSRLAPIQNFGSVDNGESVDCDMWLNITNYYATKDDFGYEFWA